MAKDEVLHIRLDEKLLLAVKRAAKRSGVPTSDYIRYSLRQELLAVAESATETPQDVFERALRMFAEAGELMGSIGGMDEKTRKIFDSIKGKKA